jgi:two-component system KDP operon response regulator KdpE
MDSYALLIVGRTHSVAEHLRISLDAEQYVIRWVPSTAQALGLDFQPALLVFDLPPSGGVRCVSRLKHRFEAPLVALLQTNQPVPNLVDAFLPRPFEVEQLVDTIQATLMSTGPHVIQAQGMSLDKRTRRLQIDHDLYQLPPIGCQLLALLMEQAGCVVPRDELFRRVWQTDDGDNTRVLDVHIAHLRRLLEPNPRRPKLILTERRVGYRLQPPG